MGLKSSLRFSFEAKYFLNHFHYYFNQLVRNIQRKRKKEATHSVPGVEPVYGIAILERNIFLTDSPVNVYEGAIVDRTSLYSSRKGWSGLQYVRGCLFRVG